MGAASVPIVQLIVYGLPLTGLGGVAALEQVAVPVTPLAASVSPFLKPESVAVKAGFASPYARVWLSAVTVSPALATVSCPLTKLVNV